MKTINPESTAKPASNYAHGVVHPLSGERLIMYQYGRLLRADEIKRMLSFMLSVYDVLHETARP